MHLWRKTRRRSWVMAAAAGLGVVWIAWAGETDNLVQLHRNARDHAKECADCHGSSGMADTSSNPRIRTAGPLHLSNPMLNFGCVTCHPSVDLEQHSAAANRVQVAATLCAKCHGVSRCPKRPHPSARRQDCVGCHKDWAAKMKASAGPLVNMDKIGPADCWKCHGGQALFRVHQR